MSQIQSYFSGDIIFTCLHVCVIKIVFFPDAK